MSDKNFKVKNGIDANGTITVLQPNTSSVPLIIKANTLATGSNMLEMQRPDGTVRFAIGNDGALTVNSNINFNGGNMTMYPGNSGQTALIVNGQTNQSVSNLIVKGASSQTANLQEWQDSSGTNLARIDSRGNLFAASILSNVSNQMYGDVNGWIVVPAAANRSAMVFRGAASQTADLTQWQDSAGSTLGSISSSGDFISVGNHSVRFAYHQNVGGTGAYLDYAQVSNTASIIQRVTTAVGLIVRGAASQTADFFQVQTNSGSSVFSVNYYGLMNASQGSFGNAIATARLNVDTSSASTVGLLVRGAIGQSADLQVWQDYGPTTKASIDTYGNAGFGGTAANSAQGLLVKTNSNAAVKGIVVVGAASQNANLQEWQDSAGTVYASINPYGQLSIGLNPTIYGNARISLNTVATTVVGMVIRGVASQTADLQQWQNSNGTVLAKVDPNGSITAGTNLIVGNATMLYTGGNYYNSTLSVATQGAGYSGIVVRGQASQTADLQQWQDSNGNVKSKVFYDGQFYTAGLTTEASYSSTLYGGYGGIIAATGTTAAVNFAPFTADRVVEKIRGYTAQTADLTQWQNSAGTVLAKVGSDGALTVNNANINYRGDFVSPFNITATFALLAGKSSQSGTYNTFLTPWSQGAAAVIVQGATSQTANLQEWQDSSGVVLSFISSSGNFSAKGLSVSTSTNTTNAGTFYNSAGTPVFNVDTSLNAINIGGGLSGSANNFASTWGYDSGLNAGYMTFATGALGSDSLAIRRTNHVSSGDYTISTLGNMRLSTASGKNFNFNNGNIGIATTAIGTNNKIIVNPYSTVDNLATVQINTNAATNKGLVVQGYTSQSANLQEWQDSTGSIQANVNNVGIFNSNNATGYQIAAATYYGTLNGGQTARVQAGGSVGANPHLVVRQSSGATGNLQEWQDSTGAVLSSVSAAGLIRVNNTNTDAMITATGNSTYDAFKFRNAGGLFLWGGGSNNNIYYASTGTFALTGGNWVSGRLAVDTGTTSSIGIVVRGQASQTANLQEWQDSTGYVMAKLASAGQFVSEGGIVSYSIRPLGFDGTSLFLPYGATGYLTVNNPAYKVIIVKGAASQTANLQEWQNSAGTVLINVDSTGNFSSNSSFSQALRFRYLDSPVIDGAYIDTRLVAGTLGVVARSTTAVTFIVRGTNSQTGDLQEWQNSSGTKIAWIDKDGNFINGNNAGIYNSITTTSLLANGGNIISTYGLYNGLPAQTNAGLAVRPWAADVVASIIRGYTSQTADLTQWQDTYGTVLAKIGSTGGATFAGLNVQSTGSAIVNIGTAAAGYVGLIITASASQTADLQQWKSSGGGIIAKIDSNGTFNASVYDFGVNTGYPEIIWGGNNTIASIRREYRSSISKFGIGTGTFHFGSNPDNANFALTDNQVGIFARSTTLTSFIVRGATSQTADLQQWQNTGGTVLARVQSDGTFVSDYVTSGQYLTSLNKLRAGGATSYGAQLEVTSTSATNIGAIIRGALSQSANLQEWQNSAGVMRTSILPDGALFSNMYATFTNAGAGGGTAIYARTIYADSVPVAIRGAASQTANLQEWQNSNGTALVSIGSNGWINANYMNLSSTGGIISASSNQLYSNNGSWLIVVPGATSKGLIIQAAASQTANIQEWQDNNGNVLTSIKNKGEIESTLARSTRTNYSSYPNATTTGIPSGKFGWSERWSGGGTSAQTVAAITNATDGPIPELTSYLRKTWTAVRSDGAHQDISFALTLGGTSAFPVSAGESYTASIYFRHSWSDLGGVGSFTNRLYFTFYDSSATQVQSTYVDQPRTNYGEWYRINGSATAPSNAAYLEVIHIFYAPTNTVQIGSTLDVTGQLVEKTSSLGEYFDGTNNRYDSKYNASSAWTGTTNTSTSTVSYISQSTNPIAIKSSSNTITSIDQYGAIVAPAIKVSGVSLSKNITASSGYRYFVDSSASRTINLPASPLVGDEIQIFDATNTAATYNIVIDSNGGKIEGVIDNYILDSNGSAVILTYTGSTYGWKVK